MYNNFVHRTGEHARPLDICPVCCYAPSWQVAPGLVGDNGRYAIEIERSK